MTDLRPCPVPWCKSAAHTYHYEGLGWRTECLKCTVVQGSYFPSRADSIAHWNHRADPTDTITDPAAIEQLEHPKPDPKREAFLVESRALFRKARVPPYPQVPDREGWWMYDGIAKYVFISALSGILKVSGQRDVPLDEFDKSLWRGPLFHYDPARGFVALVEEKKREEE